MKHDRRAIAEAIRRRLANQDTPPQRRRVRRIPIGRIAVPKHKE